MAEANKALKAALNGNLSALPLSEIENQDISTTSLSGNSLLHVAARSGNEDMTRILANKYPFIISKQNSKGDTPLHVAARAQMLKIVTILVQYADKSLLMKKKNRKENTALHDALYAIHEASSIKNKDEHNEKVTSAVALARFLVSEDPGVSYLQNIEGKSPLCLAVESQKTEILEYILKALPAHDKCSTKLQGKSPVKAAIELKNLDLLKKMADEQPDLLLIQDEEGNTPMHWAASEDHLEGVRYLYQINPDSVLGRNKKGNYPFHLACKNNSVRVMDVFFDDEKKNMPDLTTELFNNKGQSILHVAAKSGKFDAVRRLLRARNSDKLINDMDGDGNTPLHLAALHGRPLVAVTLIWDGRAKSGITNFAGLTAYDIAQQQSEKSNPDFFGNADEEDKKQKYVNEKKDKSDQDLQKAEQGQQSDSDEPIDRKTKKSSKSKLDVYNTMMTLSLLFVVQNFFFRPDRTFLGNLLKLIGNIYKESNQSPNKKDVNNRITNLIVVAALIAGAAFAASVQMASSNNSDSGGDSSKASINVPGLAFANTTASSINVECDPASSGNGDRSGEVTKKENKSKRNDRALIAFTFFNTIAMYTSITAAIILCWAQLLDANLASVDVWVASVMVMVALYFSCVAFVATTFMLSDNGAVFKVIITVLQGVFLLILTLRSFQLLVPLRMKKLYILFNYFLHLWFYFFLNWLWGLLKQTGCYAKCVKRKPKK